MSVSVSGTPPEAFLTRSTEAMTAGLYEGLTARFLELGTAKSTYTWRPALLRFPHSAEAAPISQEDDSPQRAMGSRDYLG